MLSAKFWRDNSFAWLLLLPSLVFLILFTFYPIGKTVILSLQQSDLAAREPIFIGLDNYKSLIGDSIFGKS